MNCIKEQELWEYLDGELPKAEMQQVEVHIETCSHCSSRLSELQFFDATFAGVVQKEAQKPTPHRSNTEVCLSAAERMELLKKPLRHLVAFAALLIIATTFFFTLACPISGKNIFEAEFQAMTYGISRFMNFLQTPILLNFLVIIVTFETLFKADKIWGNRRKKA
jgi:hypothetical protein